MPADAGATMPHAPRLSEPAAGLEPATRTDAAQLLRVADDVDADDAPAVDLEREDGAVAVLSGE
jgi:hypothetical protein